MFALHYGAIVLALELSHQRTVAEIELNLHRELVDDLLAGTDRDGAYARADALNHDLRRPHYVVVVQSADHTDNTLTTAAGRAATALHLNYLQGRHAGLIVLLIAGRRTPRRCTARSVTSSARPPASSVSALDVWCPRTFRSPLWKPVAL